MSLGELTMHQEFHASPERVWSAITDHEGMGKWAGADVCIVARGDEAGVGVVRRVKIGSLRIDEEVIYADAPRRMVYRVIRGAPFNFHRGELLLEPRRSGSGVERTDVTWRILMSSNVPGLVPTTKLLLGSALTRGLRELAGLIGA